jgi:hypothetical protein
MKPSHGGQSVGTVVCCGAPMAQEPRASDGLGGTINRCGRCDSIAVTSGAVFTMIAPQVGPGATVVVGRARAAAAAGAEELEPPTGTLAFGYDGGGVYFRADAATRRFAQAVARLVERARGDQVDVTEDLPVALQLLELLGADGYGDPDATPLRPFAECRQ